MKLSLVKYCWLLFICLWVSTAYAQDKRVNNTTQLWSEIDLFGRISKKWKWQCDVQYSWQSQYEQTDFMHYDEQSNIRTWVHYYPIPTIKLSAFVGWWYNDPIPEVGAREYPEIREALQAQFYKIWGLNTISNRFRTELREVKDRSDVFEPVLRYRYMFKYLRLLHHKTYDKNSIYGIFSNEFFLNGESKVTGYKPFDQNRMFVGIGYNITDDIGVETGYFNQFQHHTHDINFDSNHIWQVTLIVDNITKL